MFSLIQSLVPYLPDSVTKAVLLALFGYVSFASLDVLKTILRPYFSPLRVLKGPSGGHFLSGHFPEIRAIEDTGGWHRERQKEYGHVWVHKGGFNQDRLITTDLKALHHIMTNSMIYRKPEEVRYTLGELLGEGLLFAEGYDHKRQRRVMNPAFGQIHLRELTEIFVSKSSELRDSLDLLISRNPQMEWASADMVAYLSCTTLDIIGLAGFNYSFDSLGNLTENKQDEAELSSAFNRLFSVASKITTLFLLKRLFPILRLIQFDSRSRIINGSQSVVTRIGRQLVEDKKRVIQESQEKVQTKDLLTLLIKANLAEAGQSSDRQMSDEEVMNQIPTFLIAGHETTSTATSWALYSLAIHKDIQLRLRQEMQTISTEEPSMDDLNSLPYLDRVVREVLRYHSVVASTARFASQDDVIPLDTPFYDKYGKVHDRIHVKKGDGLLIPIKLVNTLESIWGTDAQTFNPDRWIDPPKGASDVPGIWGNQLSFIGGARACIGFRFAIVEMKALLFALIRNFEFGLAVSPDQIVQKPSIVTRPALRSELDKGFQLPMLVRRAKDSNKGL